MINYNDSYIKAHMYEGMTGLELESQRVDQTGHLSHKPHPFPGDRFIDRDFGEAQIEISAAAADSTEGAAALIRHELEKLHAKLAETGELLWPFSNPPIIKDEDDIEIARYSGDQQASYDYRVYLAGKYGKYKQAYSGIHYNYSFSDDMLRRGFELSGGSTGDDDGYREFKNRFYLDLAERVLEYSWVPVALIAASPVADGSLYDKQLAGESMFTGCATLRCSDRGYWNPFVPIISYDSIDSYVGSMEAYVEDGLLIEARELYYPVRIKPPGKYTVKALREKGVQHIELRMIDVNPFSDQGMDIRDLKFLQLFLIWLSSLGRAGLTDGEQVQAIYNHKSSAQYSWTIARIGLPGKKTRSLKECVAEVLDSMKEFYAGEEGALETLEYQVAKVENRELRYAKRVLREYGKSYIEDGLARAREIQNSYNV